mmetsp:Transcript_24442/g.61306  ORF Transcript_24442/g.61306 Transcript_24442/m.61306 type:complete len:263 (+) Transcript_24442:623-1411(+)
MCIGETGTRIARNVEGTIGAERMSNGGKKRTLQRGQVFEAGHIVRVRFQRQLGAEENASVQRVGLGAAIELADDRVRCLGDLLLRGQHCLAGHLLGLSIAGLAQEAQRVHHGGGRDTLIQHRQHERAQVDDVLCGGQEGVQTRGGSTELADELLLEAVAQHGLGARAHGHSVQGRAGQRLVVHTVVQLQGARIQPQPLAGVGRRCDLHRKAARILYDELVLVGGVAQRRERDNGLRELDRDLGDAKQVLAVRQTRDHRERRR